MGSKLKIAIGLSIFFAVVSATVVPADSVTSKNWGLYNGEARSHVNAIESYKLTRGSNKIIVAIIDTGVDSKHEYLAANIWHDKDRYIAGWNFVSDKPNPSDDHGHGTHVAGIVHAVSPNTLLLPVKYYSDSNPGSVNLQNTVKALNYAIDHDVDIINYSGGGPEPSEPEYLALKRAEEKGILVIAAAGNEHQNTDIPENRYYPAAYGLSNIITVAATDIHNNLLASSNWGQNHVDVTAPGDNIYSSLPGNRWGYMGGTSMATPFVSGIAAQIKACNPKLTYVQIKSIILSSVDRFPQLSGKIRTSGRVNEYAALLAAKGNSRCAN